LVFHDIETFMPTLTRIARLSNCTVTALDYPKAPEVSPIIAIRAVNEALGEIVRSVMKDGECLPPLVGDSIGGLIVLAAARYVPAVAKASLFLIYPVLDLSEKRAFASRERYGRSVFLDEDYMRGFRALARRGLGPDIDPLSFGVEDFERLGRVHIVSARCDVLSDEALAFVDRGRSVGREIGFIDLPGLPHDFLLFSGRVPDAANGLTVVARALSEFLDKSGAP
jgi:acetyl esterase/lipase